MLNKILGKSDRFITELTSKIVPIEEMKRITAKDHNRRVIR